MASNNKEFFNALDLLEKEKGIPKQYMIEKVEFALLSAFKKDTGCSNVRVMLDPVKTEVRVYKLMTVVDPNAPYVAPEAEQAELAEETAEDEGDAMGTLYDEEEIEKDEGKKVRGYNPATEMTLEQAHEISKRYKLGDVVEIEIKPKNFKRIPAQTAKQVIIQGIREAEREMMIKEYEDKKEEIISAVVTRVEPLSGNAVLEIGKNEVVLFKDEQIPHEPLKVGDVIKVYVTEIKTRKDSKGQAVVLSRKHPGLVKRLFELEVPEIADGTVAIKSIAREAGSRTKIAVYSKDSNVDAIGSCIGPKSIRKNNITNEIRGEKIDIIKYSESPEEFIKSALSPATVESVTAMTDEEGRTFYRAVVEEDQLSLAIGKSGQNARLAAKLTNFRIDIKSAAVLRSEAMSEIMAGKASARSSVGDKMLEALKRKAETESNPEE